MSWWNNTGISSLASVALKTAQKRIDKVLDIQGEDDNSSPPPVPTSSEEVNTSPTSTDSPAEDSEFWNKWMSTDKLSSLSSKVKAKTASSGDEYLAEPGAEKGTFSKDFFASTLSASLSKAQNLKGIGRSSILKLRSQSSAKISESDIQGESEQERDDEAKPSSKVMSGSTEVGLATGSSESFTDDHHQGDTKDSELTSTKVPVTEPLKIIVSLASPQVSTSGGSLLATGVGQTTDVGDRQLDHGITETSVEDLLNEPDDAPSGWGDVSLSILTESQASSVSSTAGETSESTTLIKESTSADICDKPVDVIGRDGAEKETAGPLPDLLAPKPVLSVVEVEANAWDIAELTDSALDGVAIEGEQVSVKIQQSSGEAQIDQANLKTADNHQVLDDDDDGEKTRHETQITDDLKSVDEIQIGEDVETTSERQIEDDDVKTPDERQVEGDVVTVGERQAADMSDLDDAESSKNSEHQPAADQSDSRTVESDQEAASLIIQTEEMSSSLQRSDEDTTDTTMQDVMDGISTREASSMEGSTDTQDELSSSNRTLTADEFDSVKVSSGSSQVILAMNPDDGHTCDETVTERTIPEQAPAGDLVKETPETKKESLPKDEAPVVNQEGGARENLTSSSYVKNMLEEAMVESMKDTDSHTDSHSSSDMVRIESGPTSGHTSADEIETNTSSDIEIISHISTPTPNGENRLFDLSPLRHALSRTMHRNSPPSHKRSDSGSSSQSRNGDELVSPDGAQKAGILTRQMTQRKEKKDVKKTEEPAEMSSALDADRLLKVCSAVVLTAFCSSGLPAILIKFSSIHPFGWMDRQPKNLLKDYLLCIVLYVYQEQQAKMCCVFIQKLAETAEILDAREHRVMELSRENIDLQEANNILRQQLEQSEEAREAEMTDLNTLTEEFTKRMSEAEKKIQAVIKEKDAAKRKLVETEAELAKRANDKAMERIMREKDQQIVELLEEGEKLSKQQLQSNNIIKKLRVKEKENESSLKSQRTKLDEQKAEIERLLTVLDNKMDNEKKQAEAISQLNNAVLLQEAEINRLKSELEDCVEKNRSFQVILDNSYKEIGELHKAQAARASEAQEFALSAEIKAKEQLQVTLEQYKQRMKQEQEGLITQIEDLQLSLGRMEKEHGRREDILRQEIADLQKRLQEAEERNQELTQSVTQATRPLLRQIENLQATFSAQTASYEKVEKNLTERLTEAQTGLALAQEKERNAIDRVIEVDVKLSTLESQVSQLRQEKSRLQAALEMEKTKLELLEDTRNNETAQLEAQKLNYQKEIDEMRKEKMLLENQLEMEKVRTEAEKKKINMLHEQLREKEIQLMQTRKAATSPTPSFSRESSFTAESSINISQHEEVLEKTLMLATANGGKTSLYESLKQAGATTILENLQAQLKMRDGEIAQLQSEIQELERTRESMARELVSLTNQNELIEDQLKEYPEFIQKYKDLDQRYNALLMMYGEKVEEAEELRLDLQDVKDLYRAQIDELLKNK
ncbi:hypothetical protein LSH36_320g05005 [Paralvinella palmiformis]|uniref:TATA element modulatory factor 1 TATA binding domain-containing protein n=1 Tax=Paralvinella palmiformis TaxID=53620 RepID=A0AAD9JGJ0_9ANNE|nr:hypothetical protein LSH36_320g05005 [Paralvinella palmiformis]